MPKATALKPSKGGKQYHINCKKGDLAEFVLLPGDPDRVRKVAKIWDDYKEVSRKREFQVVTGHFKKTRISCLSTGIGAPGTTIVIEEAARIGVKTMIRIGSTGALQRGMLPGDLVITTGAVKLEGTSEHYVRPEYPSVAHPEVVLALIEACERLKVRYHIGLTATSDSFYVGEGRKGFGGFQPVHAKNLIKELQQAQVLNIEMEASVLLTLGSLYKLRTGALCVVFDNMITNKWKVCGEEALAKVASEAIAILNQWDILKKKKKKKYFYPSLLK